MGTRLSKKEVKKKEAVKHQPCHSCIKETQILEPGKHPTKAFIVSHPRRQRNRASLTRNTLSIYTIHQTPVIASYCLRKKNSIHFPSTHFLERTIHIFTMLFTKQIVTLAIALLGMSSMVAATPVPCTDRIRDQVLMGQLDPSACCSYGVCKGDVNIQGA